MGLPVTVTKALTVAADDDGICASQTPSGAGNLTINGALASGGVASLTSQRRVLVTCGGADSGRTFTVYGTKQGGAPISEAIAGSAGSTTQSNLDFLTVTRVAVDAATAGAVKVGTSEVGSTDWQSVDTFVTPPNIGIQLTLTGTANFSIETTQYDANNLPAGITYPAPSVSPSFNGLSASYAGTINDAVAMFRLTINSGTGSVNMTYGQAGLSSP